MIDDADYPDDMAEFKRWLIKDETFNSFLGHRKRMTNNLHHAHYTKRETWGLAAFQSGYNEWTKLAHLPLPRAEVRAELAESAASRKNRTSLINGKKNRRSGRVQVEEKKQKSEDPQEIDFDAIHRVIGNAEYFECTEWVFQHMGDTREQIERVENAPGPALQMLARVLSGDLNYNKFMDRYHKVQELKKQREMGKKAMRDDGRRQMEFIREFRRREGLYAGQTE